MVEQLTFNQQVVGSNPTRYTKGREAIIIRAEGWEYSAPLNCGEKFQTRVMIICRRAIRGSRTDQNPKEPQNGECGTRVGKRRFVKPTTAHYMRR